MLLFLYGVLGHGTTQEAVFSSVCPGFIWDRATRGVGHSGTQLLAGVKPQHCLMMLLEKEKNTHSNDNHRYFWLARHRFNSYDLLEWYNYDINFHHVS